MGVVVTSHTETEIASQPACWERAIAMAGSVAAELPTHGERVAVVGCGTSWFMGQSYAAAREAAGHGETDAFAASEWPAGRRYDRVLALSRSGTTTEVADLLDRIGDQFPSTAITAVADSPIARAAGQVVLLDFADEVSVVQTRFATTLLALLRAHLGLDLSKALTDADRALADPLPTGLAGAEQVTFLGQGWAYGLAQEAALKLREAAGAWTEAYPATEYRHGPITITRPGRVTWMFGIPPAGLADDVANTGGAFIDDHLDPLADLIRAQRLAVAVAQANGLDPDHPHNLTRSVILG
jgi:fructoselysine-6-P-deglycase FrlB-like protein